MPTLPSPEKKTIFERAVIDPLENLAVEAVKFPIKMISRGVRWALRETFDFITLPIRNILP